MWSCDRYIGLPLYLDVTTFYKHTRALLVLFSAAIRLTLDPSEKFTRYINKCQFVLSLAIPTANEEALSRK